MKPQLPYRPRLSEEAMMRRHRVDGEDKGLIFDTRKAKAIEITLEELALLACADGTRDLGGILLEATRRGVYRRASTLTTLLASLQEQDLLSDGIPQPPRTISRLADDVPLDVLDDFSLICDQNGSCCSTYSSVALTESDTARVRAVIDDATFLPLYGSAPSHFCAADLEDGHCGFLADDGSCRIHSAAGAEAKPRGCHLYPASFVYDGEAVRVAVSVECSCVLDSLGRRDGNPLVPAGANCAADLLAATSVAHLQDTFQLTATFQATRDELRSWTQAVYSHCVTLDDPLAASWALAGCIETEGLNVSACLDAMLASVAPDAADLSTLLQSLATTTAQRANSSSAWRSAKDRSRRLGHWLREASQALLVPNRVDELLAEAAGNRTTDRFYLRSTIFSYELVAPKTPRPASTLVTALRDRSIRMLLAREMRSTIPDDCQHDPSVKHPITAVEAMMRGQGLVSYAADL